MEDKAMTTVTNELMYEVLKRIQDRLDRIEDNTRDMSGQLQAMREHMSAQNKDIGNIYTKLVGHDLRLERIEQRLELISEPAH
jgi:archaellum component FlaC